MQELKIRINEDLKDNVALSDFLQSLPQTFDHTGTEIHQGRNVLKIMDASRLGIEGVDRVVVKRYHGLFWFQKLDYTFIRRPKCRKAFDNTAELRRRGFEAARELATVEVWNHGLYQYAFFVSEVGRGERLDSMVVRLMEQGEVAQAKAIMTLFAQNLYRMHQRGILYKDMNGGNVMVSHDEDCQGTEGWHFCLIDTNRAHFFPETMQLSLEQCMPDLILMNPKMQLVEFFIGEYLHCRGIYSEAEVARIRAIQRKRHEKKHPVKNFFKRYKKRYYKWLEG